jgi:predicted CXXCH cytochrome family protein
MDYKLKGPGQILKAVFLSILMLLVLSEFAYARVTGVCSNCHTMHNSQNATNMQLGSTYQWGLGGVDGCIECHGSTRVVLLRLDCLGCHAKAINDTSNIIDGWPQVALDVNATALAGGNYKHVFSDDTHGHNVHGFGGIIATDSNIGNTPPGYKSDYDPSYPSTGGYLPGNSVGQVMCAGQYGCHGNRNQLSPILAMKGTHHANDSILKFGAGFTETGQGGGTGSTSDFTTAGKSYRFLYNVHGAEDANWEGVTPGPTVHNEYKGAVFGARSGQTWNQISTISQFCGECHGDFHASGSSGIGSASPWLRHPTDVVLPASGEYTAYTAYSTEAPVARQSIADGTTTASGTVTPGTDIVMCLSCHRAHASQFPDALRWDYSNMSAGRGCYICHTQKDDNL